MLILAAFLALGAAAFGMSSLVDWADGVDTEETDVEELDTDLSGLNIIEGTQEDDILSGTDEGDLIRARAGYDTVNGGAGDDDIIGGRGNDTLFGGSGDDILNGNDEDDDIFGEDGDDTLFGHTGADTLDGGAGDDSLTGAAGDDDLSGGQGNDELIGAFGRDTLDGGAGSDMLSGGDGNDLIYAASDAELDADILDGGTNNDTLIASDGDTVSAGSGRDDIYISQWQQGGEPVFLTDFDGAQDALYVIWDDTAPGQTTTPELTLTTNSDGQAEIRLNGFVVGESASGIAVQSNMVTLLARSSLSGSIWAA